MPRQGATALPALHVPDPDGPVLAAGEQGRALERETVDPVAVPRQGATALPALHVPDPDGPVRAAGEQGRAVERETVD